MPKGTGRPSTKSKSAFLITLAITAIIIAGCISVSHQGNSSSTPITSGDCLESARAAGLPDDVLDKIENPKEMNRVQKFAIRKTLEGAGLSEVCESALDG